MNAVNKHSDMAIRKNWRLYPEASVSIRSNWSETGLSCVLSNCPNSDLHKTLARLSLTAMPALAMTLRVG
jgi:hypothetical protein